MLALLLLSLHVGRAFSACAGSLNIEGYGEVFVTTDSWSVGFVDTSNNQLRIQGAGGAVGFQFATKCIDGYEGDMWAQFYLNEQHFDYDVDVSNVDCGCNADITFVDMPAPNPGPGGTWYCDGNFVNDNWCPEYDLQESNLYAFVATLHKCDWDGNWFSSCDRGGCQANSFKIDPNMYCPEDRCTINSRKPYHVSHYQDKGGANVYFNQEGREVNFNICNDAGYNDAFSYSYENMAVAGGIWGGGGTDMGWLDGVTGCQENCNLDNSHVVFSNFRVW